MKNLTGKKIDEILNDNDLMSKLDSADSSQEISEILAENGVDITAEEIDQVITEAIKQRIEAGEISEAELEKVAGGKKGWWKWLIPGYAIGRLIVWGIYKSGGC